MALPSTTDALSNSSQPDVESDKLTLNPHMSFLTPSSVLQEAREEPTDVSSDSDVTDLTLPNSSEAYIRQ